ncbi:RNA polymerase subunit sigma-70, partial [Klebsiella oxytoca]
RPRKFCSEKCRRQWWKAHPQEGNRKAIVTKKCECCGREFSFYRSRKPKYCSYDCYIKARFWRD